MLNPAFVSAEMFVQMGHCISQELEINYIETYLSICEPLAKTLHELTGFENTLIDSISLYGKVSKGLSIVIEVLIHDFSKDAL